MVKPRPRNVNSSRGSLRANRLIKHMPRLVELNMHVGVPLYGMLRNGQLATVRTLSVPINQVAPVYESTHIIQACPNVTLLRLNITGQLIRTGDCDKVYRPECQRALKAAAALESLRALEMFKFGSYEVCRFSHFFGYNSSGLHHKENGWVPGDLKGMWKYLHMCALTNVDTNSKFSHQGVLSLYLQSGSLRKCGI